MMEDMPDPYEAKESIWLPFIRDKLKVDGNTIVVGHSSGAEAAVHRRLTLMPTKSPIQIEPIPSHPIPFHPIPFHEKWLG